MTSKVWDKQIGGSHYQKFKIQPSKFVIDNKLLYPEGCVIKYIIRHSMKNGKEDLLKAKHFIDMIKLRILGRGLSRLVQCTHNKFNNLHKMANFFERHKLIKFTQQIRERQEGQSQRKPCVNGRSNN